LSVGCRRCKPSGPQTLNWVGIKGCIGADDLHLVDHRLSYQQPVKGVAVVLRHLCQCGRARHSIAQEI